MYLWCHVMFRISQFLKIYFKHQSPLQKCSVRKFQEKIYCKWKIFTLYFFQPECVLELFLFRDWMMGVSLCSVLSRWFLLYCGIKFLFLLSGRLSSSCLCVWFCLVSALFKLLYFFFQGVEVWELKVFVLCGCTMRVCGVLFLLVAMCCWCQIEYNIGTRDIGKVNAFGFLVGSKLSPLKAGTPKGWCFRQGPHFSLIDRTGRSSPFCCFQVDLDYPAHMKIRP